MFSPFSLTLPGSPAPQNPPIPSGAPSTPPSPPPQSAPVLNPTAGSGGGGTSILDQRLRTLESTLSLLLRRPTFSPSPTTGRGNAASGRGNFSPLAPGFSVGFLTRSRSPQRPSATAPTRRSPSSSTSALRPRSQGRGTSPSTQ